MCWLQSHPGNYRLCKAHPQQQLFCKSALLLTHLIQQQVLPALSPASHYTLPGKGWAFGFALPFNSWFLLDQREPCQHKEQEEKRAYVWLLSGWVRSWNGLCLYFSFLPLSQLPDVLGSATEWRRKETRLFEFIHTAHRAALTSSCLQGSISPSDNGRQRQADKWIGEEGEEEGREERKGRETRRGRERLW